MSFLKKVEGVRLEITSMVEFLSYNGVSPCGRIEGVYVGANESTTFVFPLYCGVYPCGELVGLCVTFPSTAVVIIGSAVIFKLTRTSPGLL